jgi:hypothetical protein
MSGTLHHTTRAHTAYEPRYDGIRPGWLVVVVCLVLTAGAALAVRPVCVIDVPGARESAAGVRHVKRAGRWYHCEPWVSRAIRD